MTFKEEVKKLLLERRPSLSQSSLTTYSSFLNTLSKHIDPSLTPEQLFKQDDKIYDFLKDKSISQKKTILSALYVPTNNDKYKRKMLELAKIDNDKYDEQKLSATESANWLTQEQIKKKYDEMYPIAIKMLNKQSDFDFQFLNKFILFCFMSGLFIPSRRSRDYSLMKVRNYDKKQITILPIKVLWYGIDIKLLMYMVG